MRKLWRIVIKIYIMIKSKFSENTTRKRASEFTFATDKESSLHLEVH